MYCLHMVVSIPFFQQVSDLLVPPNFSTMYKTPNCKFVAYIVDKNMYMFQCNTTQTWIYIVLYCFGSDV